MILGITGLRPSKLNWGYDMDSPYWMALRRYLMHYFIEHNVTEVITGMALGVDTAAALAVLDLKDQGYDIRLHCAIPCRNQESRWLPESQRLYKSILDRADLVILVTDAPYSPWLMQTRNQYIVNISDQMLAIWDGSRGGTANCIDYAQKMRKPITVVQPLFVLETNYGL